MGRSLHKKTLVTGTGHHSIPCKVPAQKARTQRVHVGGHHGPREVAISQAGRAETFFWKGIEALGEELSFLSSGSVSQKHPAPGHSAAVRVGCALHTHLLLWTLGREGCHLSSS